MPTVETYEADVDRALQTFEQQKAGLFQPDGKKIYADDEHERRLEALWTPVQRAKDAFDSHVTTATTEAQTAVERVEGYDLSEALSTEELARANNLRAFVQEDIDAMTVSEIVDRLQAVAHGSDKARAFVFLRYAQKRFERRKPGEETHEDWREVRTLLSTLEQKLRPATQGQGKTEAQATLTAISAARMRITTKVFEASGEAERLRDQMRRTGMYSRF